MSEPWIVRYRNLLLPAIIIFTFLTLLAIPTLITLGYWPLSIVSVGTLVAALYLYGKVKDYRP